MHLNIAIHTVSPLHASICVKAWIVTDDTSKRLEAFEMWCYCRMLRIYLPCHK